MSQEKLHPNLVEAANRAEATAILVGAGFRVYRPEADVGGEDLVVLDPNDLELKMVQLKSRPIVDLARYGPPRKIWMLFPDPSKAPMSGRDWFLIRHDELFEWVKERHQHTRGWKDYWSYPAMSVELRERLRFYTIKAPDHC